jgi:hypothetical protein
LGDFSQYSAYLGMPGVCGEQFGSGQVAYRNVPYLIAAVGE